LSSYIFVCCFIIRPSVLWNTIDRNSVGLCFCLTWLWCHAILSYVTPVPRYFVLRDPGETLFCPTWFWRHFILSYVTLVTRYFVLRDSGDTLFCPTWLWWHVILSYVTLVTRYFVLRDWWQVILSYVTLVTRYFVLRDSGDTLFCPTWLCWHVILSYVTGDTLFCPTWLWWHGISSNVFIEEPVGLQKRRWSGPRSRSDTRGVITIFSVFSGFRRDVDEICGLLGYYTASCGNYLPLIPAT
jgi:hypothetical protein